MAVAFAGVLATSIVGIAAPAQAQSDVGCAYVSHWEKTWGGQHTGVGNPNCPWTITVRVIVDWGPDSGCLSVPQYDAKVWDTSIGDYGGIEDC
jgi:hypothetical protein